MARGYDGGFVPSGSRDNAPRAVRLGPKRAGGAVAHFGDVASRGYNIDSLAVGETEDPRLSRMTFVVVGDDAVLEQVWKQLEKIVTVVRVDNVGRGVRGTGHDADQGLRSAGPPRRDRPVDEHLPRPDRRRGPWAMIIEMSGQESKIEAFIEMMRPLGIIELAGPGESPWSAAGRARRPSRVRCQLSCQLSRGN